MMSPALRWKATTGFLMMIFLLPGMYALECYTFTSFHQFDSKGRRGFEQATVAGNSTCSSGNDVCLSVEFELSTDENTLLVSHKGCFTKNPRDVEGATIFGHQYFAIRSNLSYCYQDFCNIRSAFADFPTTTSKGTEASHPNGSIHCYSGQNRNASELTLERVTCSNRSDLCYQGRHAIKVAGNITQVFYIRSCQNPSCDVPKHRVFGPVELNFLEGSCCSASNCNGEKGTSKISNDISGPTGGPYGEGAGNHTTSFTDSNAGTSKEDSDYDTESDDDTVSEKTPNSPINPRARGPKSKGSSLQFCPLLLAIGMTVLELGW